MTAVPADVSRVCFLCLDSGARLSARWAAGIRGEGRSQVHWLGRSDVLDSRAVPGGDHLPMADRLTVT